MPVASRFCLTQPGRAAEVARLSSYRTRTSRNVRPMLQSSSRASPMVQPVAGHHPALGCMPGCHGKHPPQPGLQTWFTVIQATRGWLSTLIEGARPSGDHQRSSGKRTEQARYLRAIDAGCRPTRCSSCAPRELLRRAETFSSAPACAAWTQRAPEQSQHSAQCAECWDCSAGLLRQGAWPRAALQNSALAGAFQPFLTTLHL